MAEVPGSRGKKRKQPRQALGLAGLFSLRGSGGGGNRTRVSEYFSAGFYVCSLLISGGPAPCGSAHPVRPFGSQQAGPQSGYPDRKFNPRRLRHDQSRKTSLWQERARISDRAETSRAKVSDTGLPISRQPC
jgi:hypothetical protein